MMFDAKRQPSRSRRLGPLAMAAMLPLVVQFGLAMLPEAAGGIVDFANIDVTGTNNASTVTTIAQGTPDFHIGAGGNYGDYYPTIGASSADDVAGGILFTCVRENGRGGVFSTSQMDGTSNYWIPVHRVASNRGEHNANIAAAYFPFADGWTAGRAYNSSGANGGANDTLNATPGLAVGTHFFDDGGGQSRLFLPGVDSRTSGILLVMGGKNEGNFALSAPSADGSHYRIAVKDNYANGSSYEQDPLAFVHVPLGTPNVVMGRIIGDSGGTALSQGDFTLRRTAAGTFQLDIAGQDPTTGVLLVSPEGFGNYNFDNVVTYQANGGGWEIQTRDLPGMGLQDPHGNPLLNFAFMPFDNPPTAPAAPRTFDPNGIAAANVEVTEFNPGNGNGDMFARVSEGSPGLGISSNNRGDIGIAWQGRGLALSDGVLLGTIREHIRDNSATGGLTDYGVIDTDTSVHTSRADPVNGEHNINFAVALFPSTSGFSTAAGVPTASGAATLTVPGSGDTRRSGVLIVTPRGNDDNFATIGTISDGSGWNIQLRDNNSGMEGGTDTFNYGFLPYGSENLVAGTMSFTGYLQNRAGDFTLAREGGGLYRLSIPGQSPETGMLLLTPTVTEFGGDYSHDNTVSYRADGNDFLIQGIDMQPNGTHGPQDTSFNFAFVGFDSPPSNPQPRAFDPAAVAAANIKIDHNNAANGATSITATTEQSSDPSFTVANGSNGDYTMKLDGVPFSVHGGVALATPRNHVRDNSATGGRNDYGIIAGRQDELHSHVASSTNGEHDFDFAVAFFPDAAGFATGLNHPHSGGVGTVNVTGAGDTRYSGLLMVNAYGNSDNFAVSQPLADGTGWTVENRDNSSGLQGEGVNWAFLPYGTENLVAAKVNGAGYVRNKTGQFALTREGTGLYRLTVAGETPETGMLLLNATKDGASDDNTLSYRADGGDFLIQGIDMQGNDTHGPQDTDFNFAFMSFDNPLANPQLRTLDPTRISAGMIDVVQNDTGNAATSVSVSTPWTTDAFSVGNANRGDFHPYVNGRNIVLDDGILMASVRSNGRDNSVTDSADTEGTVYGIASVEHNGLTGGTWIAVDRIGSNRETNLDLAAAFFPFDGGYVGGHFASDGTSRKDTLPTGSTLTRTATGRYGLAMPGVDSRTDGLLFAINGSNSDNVFTAAVLADGSGWDIGSYDNQANLGGFQNEDFSLLFLPLQETDDILALGRVGADGTVAVGAGGFSISHRGPGEYLLSLDAHLGVDDGVLLLTGSELDGGTPADNVFSYEPLDGSFLIQSRDLPGALLEDAGFAFAFLPVASLAVPEPGSVILLAMGASLLFLLPRRRRGHGR